MQLLTRAQEMVRRAKTAKAVKYERLGRVNIWAEPQEKEGFQVSLSNGNGRVIPFAWNDEYGEVDFNRSEVRRFAGRRFRGETEMKLYKIGMMLKTSGILAKLDRHNA